MRKAWPASLITLTILCLGFILFALGQGGTGRLPSNTNSSKKPPASKPKPSPRKIKPKPSTAPANNTGKPKSETAAKEAAATEQTYWDSIRLSINPEDFKAYLKKYPNGQFAQLAKNSLQRLAAQPKPREKMNANSKAPASSSVNPTPKPGSIVTNQLGMELVYVPAGRFSMGSNSSDINERPMHEVTIKEGFYIGRYEVTQAEWKQVMGNNPSYFKGDRLPVEQVTWGDAERFVNALNARGERFFHRLPSESEWEYACRAGTTGDYAGELTEMAWFSANSGRRTQPVGGKRPNAWGLYDMHGNVWEWCADIFHESYVGEPTDGSARQTGTDLRRVLRGGSWLEPARFLRSGFRLGNSSRTSSCGFRVVAIPPMVLGGIG